ERAFVTIVERYRRELVAQARRLDSGGRAEDLVQQTFLSAFAALQSGAEVAHLRGWLHQILRHAAIRSLSRERPADALDAALLAGASLEESVESRLLVSDLLAELGRLPTRQRQAIVEMSLAGRSRAEVASSMGLSEGAVRQLVHRARATLRTAVTALTPYPLAQFLGAVHSAANTDGATDLAIGAGTASAGGAVVKLGALVASAAVATAVVAAPPSHHHRRGVAAASAHVTTHAGRHQGASRAAAARDASFVTATVHPRTASQPSGGGSGSAGRTAAHHRDARGGERSRGGSSPGGSGGDGSRNGPGPTRSEGGGSGSGPDGTHGGDGASGSSSGSGGGDSQVASTDGGGPGPSGSPSTGGSGSDGGGGGSTPSDGGSGGGSSGDAGSTTGTQVSISGSGSDGGSSSGSSGSSSGSTATSGSSATSGPSTTSVPTGD
ncbi:MAG TPA: sigma-70 family RNA polymerase sigma factor, partial [Solirubrobacteraceae bacterium]|nr:sigma-70 family RNA polymerase sigma factor [Solirubrobacteraceae bacterium]